MRLRLSSGSDSDRGRERGGSERVKAFATIQ